MSGVVADHLAALKWQSPHVLGIALLLGAGAGVLIVALYWSSLRPLRLRWRVALPGLRCMAVLAMALSVGRPVTERRLDQTEQGSILILVDASMSMSVRDVRKTPAMLVGLAEGLGRLAAGVRARPEAFATLGADLDRLPALIEAIVQSQGELELAALQGKQNPAARQRFNVAVTEFGRVGKALVLARERIKAKSPRLAEAIAGLERLPAPGTSKDWAKSAGTVVAAITLRATQAQNEADEALYRTNPSVKAICDELAMLSRFELAEFALVGDPRASATDGHALILQLAPKTPVYGYTVGSTLEPLALRGAAGSPVRRLVVSPGGLHTDLTGGLHQGLDQLRHANVSAVVIFSDGRQVGAAAAIASSVLGGAESIPIYTVCCAPPEKASPVVDVAIESVSVAGSVFVGETLGVTVEVQWSGRARPSRATLEIDGVVHEAPIQVRSNTARGAARFAVRMENPGPQRLEISVPPIEGEITTENNSVTRHVKVLADKFEVLLAGGASSWDFRGLRDVLAQTSWINGTVSLLDWDQAALAATAAQIARNDVIILDDVSPRAMSDEQWGAIRSTVAQRGASLILVAGPMNLPRRYGAEAMADLLPWRRPATRSAGPAWRQWPGEAPEFRVVAHSSSGLAEALAPQDASGDSTAAWLALPKLFRHLSMPPLKENVETILVERETGSPILTRHRMGRGHVYFLGIDETWRWRTGSRHQQRFFLQLVRMAADEPYAATSESLSLDVGQIVIDPAHSTAVRARINVPPDAQAWPTSLPMEVLSEDAVLRTQMLARVGQSDSGRYEGTVGNLATGDYRIRVRGPDGSELDYPLRVERSREAEMANLTPDEELLRRLASTSGGEFLGIEQVRGLPEKLAKLRETRPTTAEFALWSSWYLYGFVVGCLGLEWALRKRLGLS